MDVEREFENTCELLGGVLSVVADEDHRIQAEATGSPVGKAFKRRRTSTMEGYRCWRDLWSDLLGDPICHLLSLRQVIRGRRKGSAWSPPNRHHCPWSHCLQHGLAHYVVPHLGVPGSMRE